MKIGTLLKLDRFKLLATLIIWVAIGCSFLATEIASTEVVRLANPELVARITEVIPQMQAVIQPQMAEIAKGGGWWNPAWGYVFALVPWIVSLVLAYLAAVAVSCIRTRPSSPTQSNSSSQPTASGGG